MIRPAKDLAEKFAAMGNDTIAIQYWNYEDVILFVEGNDYYDDITENAAREVWGIVAAKLLKFEVVDCDVVQDTIAEVLDEEIGVN